MSKKADFLVEIGTEELPPKALRSLEQAFATNLLAGIRDAGLNAGKHASFATPRRLAVLISDLELSQPQQRIQKRGPSVAVAFDADDKPTRAALAFANSCGVEVGDLERQKTDKGEWLLFRTEKPGRITAELLPDIVAAALNDLPIPKRMRWGVKEVEFVRPVHWVVMLLGNRVVECEILGIEAGSKTYGHRFHAPGPIRIKAPIDYPELLTGKGYVLPSFEQRSDRIGSLAEAAAAELGGEVILEPGLLDEVTALVEWPIPVTGKFDPEFLLLPEEVLIATLQNHQCYFPVWDTAGKLMPAFIAISNLDSRDPDQVRSGNERVVAPRLADAAFFWAQDCRSTLDSRREALGQVVFQKALGSLLDKSVRVGKLAARLAADLGADKATVRRAAELAKADLLTEMVGEFPELQGRMGYYYALNDGESEAIAAAIEEQYLPRHAGGTLPGSSAGQSLAIADRLDTLAGIFATGKRPSGNKDPFGLRRAALAVARILIEHGIEIDLRAHLQQAIAAQPVKVANTGALLDELHAFIVDRMKAYFLEGRAPGLEHGSITAEIFESVRARKPVSPLDFHQRLTAVCRFMQHDAADSLTLANKRIANILKSADAEPGATIDPKLFDADEERDLHAALGAITPAHRKHLKRREYATILEDLAALKEPVDAYFDAVMVMVDDAKIRRNRLNLLSQLRELFLDVADLSCIPSQ